MDPEIKAIIVDDDFSSRNILQKFLEIDNKVIVVASENNTADAMKAFESLVPDVIFLDINMPVEDGLEFAKKLRLLGSDVQIVFTTAYRDYAASAFSIKPLDYLVKPFGLSDVFDVLTKIQNYFEEKEQLKIEQRMWGTVVLDKLKLKTKAGYLFVNLNEIFYFKVFGAITEMYYVNGGKERVQYNLSNLFNDIKPLGFLRINRSVIVNLNYVERIENKSHICVMKCNGKEYDFAISRSFLKYFENIKSIKLG